MSRTWDEEVYMCIMIGAGKLDEALRKAKAENVQETT